MNLAEEIHNSWHIIGRNKVRSFLTMLGVTIGIASVIVVMAVGAGAQSLILNQVKSMGSDLIGVLPGKADEKGPPASVYGVVITSLKDEDGLAIMKSGFPHITAYTSYVKGTDTVTRRDSKTDATFVGVNAGYINVEDAPVAGGRFFTDEEDRSLSRVAVLGSQTAKELFDDENPIGQQIKIKKTNFTVIGVIKARGNSGF
ncbi:MAG TPA: ABC transporter permease, partial [Patescibacteria group bacterium]|nr:ABC transporter permease [Patescibacteria group bacterium]